MAAASFDHGIAVFTHTEARPEADSQRNVYFRHLSLLLDESGINHNQDRELCKDMRLWVDKNRNLSRVQNGWDLVGLNEPGSDSLHCMHFFINCFGKGNSSPHSQGLGKFADHYVDTRTVQPYYHA